jgi:phosphate transport system substrate-binding protein
MKSSFRPALLAAALALVSLSLGCGPAAPAPATSNPSSTVGDTASESADTVADSEPASEKSKSEATRSAAIVVDPELPTYEPTQGVSGRIKSVGSDTMNKMMSMWLEGFKFIYPSIETEFEGKGSGTAVPALIEGAANFGPCSRDLKPSEISDFQARFGYKPTLLPTSIDMLAVYVHKDNPLKGLTLQQVDAIFSKTRKGGAAKEIRTWGELGLTGEWADKPISLYGRNSASGTYGYFKERALFNGDFKDTVKEQPGSSAVVQGVAGDRYGIGYSGIGYKTADVVAVPLAEIEGDPFVDVLPANAYSGDYPMARFLWLTVNYQPQSDLDPLNREFIRYIFSKQGQESVVEDGYLPVGLKVATEALQSVGIEAGK